MFGALLLSLYSRRFSFFHFTLFIYMCVCVYCRHFYLTIIHSCSFSLAPRDQQLLYNLRYFFLSSSNIFADWITNQLNMANIWFRSAPKKTFVTLFFFSLYNSSWIEQRRERKKRFTFNLILFFFTTSHKFSRHNFFYNLIITMIERELHTIPIDWFFYILFYFFCCCKSYFKVASIVKVLFCFCCFAFFTVLLYV